MGPEFGTRPETLSNNSLEPIMKTTLGRGIEGALVLAMLRKNPIWGGDYGLLNGACVRCMRALARDARIPENSSLECNHRAAVTMMPRTSVYNQR
jgi:hypothetical protein